MELTLQSIRASVKRLIAEQFGVEETVVGDDKVFQEYGADSLDQVELTIAVEDQFGIEIPDDDAFKFTSCDDVVDYVATRKNVTN